MSFKLEKIYAPTPVVNRGQPIHLGADPKCINILYCTGNSVVIRNTIDLSISDLYQDHTQSTTVAKYAPSGFYIASADSQGKVRIWDTINSEHILKGEYQIISGPIFDLAWSEDSKRIVCGGSGKEKFGHSFMFDTGANVGEISGHSKAIISIDLRQTRPYRVITGSEDLLVNFYQGPPFKFQDSRRNHQRFINCVRFSPDGAKVISVGGDKQIIVYDGKTGEEIASVKAEYRHTLGVYNISWSPDSSKFLTASADKTCKMWNANSLECITTFKFGDQIDDQQLGCLWMGSTLLSVSLSGNINYLDVDNPDSPKRIIRGHNKLITALNFDRISRKLYSADFSGKVVEWDVEDHSTKEFKGEIHKNQVSSIEVSGSNLITIAMDDTVKISSLISMDWGESIALECLPTGLGCGKNNKDLIVVCGGENIIVLRSGKIVYREKTKYIPTRCAISLDETEVAVGGKDNKIHLYTLDGDKLVHKSDLLGHRGEITGLLYSHDGTYLASSDSNRELIVWKGTTQVISDWVYHTSRINNISWSPDNIHIASVSTDTHAYIWNVEKPTTKIHIKNAHMGGATTVTWINDHTVATGGQDCSIKLWCLNY